MIGTKQTSLSYRNVTCYRWKIDHFWRLTTITRSKKTLRANHKGDLFLFSRMFYTTDIRIKQHCSTQIHILWSKQEQSSKRKIYYIGHKHVIYQIQSISQQSNVDTSVLGGLHSKLMSELPYYVTKHGIIHYYIYLLLLLSCWKNIINCFNVSSFLDDLFCRLNAGVIMYLIVVGTSENSLSDGCAL